jgi:hypothetical protein
LQRLYRFKQDKKILMENDFEWRKKEAAVFCLHLFLENSFGGTKACIQNSQNCCGLAKIRIPYTTNISKTHYPFNNLLRSCVKSLFCFLFLTNADLIFSTFFSHCVFHSHDTRLFLCYRSLPLDRALKLLNPSLILILSLKPSLI